MCDRELFPAVIYANENYSTTIHTNARERLEVPAFDVATCPKQISLQTYNMSAVNTSGKGFPTCRVAAAYRRGSFFFEISVDKLQYGGFLLIGVGSLNLPENTEYMPGEKYNSYGYSSSGEIFALGEVVSGGHTHFQEGDMVGLICNLDKMTVTFYINTHQALSISVCLCLCLCLCLLLARAHSLARSLARARARSPSRTGERARSPSLPLISPIPVSNTTK
jgi:hypothetical protein